MCIRDSMGDCLTGDKLGTADAGKTQGFWNSTLGSMPVRSGRAPSQILNVKRRISTTGIQVLKSGNVTE